MCSPAAADPYNTTDWRPFPYAARSCETSSSSVIRAMGHQDRLEPPPPNPPPPPPQPPPIGMKMGKQPRRPRPPPSMERITKKMISRTNGGMPPERREPRFTG